MRDTPPSPTVAFHPTATTRAVRFGPYRFDLLDKTLTREGAEIRLPPRALAILEYLLARPGRVVPKSELIDAVWKDAFVGESSLTEAIGVLRQALGDTASEAAYIQTVHRRGYRFVAPIQIDAQASPAPVIELARPPAPAAPAARTWPARAALVAVAVLAAVAGIAWLYTPRTPDPRVTRATITLPEAEAPAPSLTSHPVAAISPDGRQVVYVAGSPGTYRLFVRAIDQFDAMPIPGTDGGLAPFFSPDGASIGFFKQGHLFVQRLPNGEPLQIAEAYAGLGGWWLADDTIVFATGRRAGLLRVPAAGGTPSPVPIGTLNPATLRHPSVSPDGRTLFATQWNLYVRDSEVVAIDIETGASRILVKGVHPRPLDAHHIVYLRDHTLFALPLAGDQPSVALQSGVMTGVTGAGQYSVSTDGTLLYLPHLPERMQRTLTLTRHDGSSSPLFEPRAFQNIAVSWDGKQVAATIYDSDASDLWVGDVDRATLRRLTTEGGAVDPVWSRDGRFVYFGSPGSGAFQVYRAPADGTGGLAPISDLRGVSPTAAWPGGLLLQRVGAAGDRDVVRVAPDGSASDWLATRDVEAQARISPDGTQVAYQSNRSGRFEIYVRPLHGGTDRQLSSEGGSQPAWSADGRYVYWFSRPRLMRAEAGEGALGRPERVLEDPDFIDAKPTTRGLVVLSGLAEMRPLTTLNVVVNWYAEIRNRIAR